MNGPSLSRAPARTALLLLALALSWGAGAPAWGQERARVEWQEPTVNVRSGPNLGASRVGRLARGAEVEVLGERAEWTRVRHAGGEGWVVTRSLRRLPATAPEPAAAAPPPEPARTETSGPHPPPPHSPEPAQAPPPAAAPPAVPDRDAGDLGYLSGLEETPSPSYEPGPGLLRLLSGLLLVLALLAGLVWALRKLSGGGLLAGGRRAGPIRVLAARAVGPRQGLVLVEVGGLVWLLSQGPEGLRLVAEIRDEAALERLNGQYGFRETPFETALRNRLDIEGAEPGQGATAAPAGNRSPGEGAATSPEERLAALRRRPPAGGGTP
ncbi:MAG: flagellar biosynthetic protein FliO [Thermodesulfobacteriota bacterium]